MGAEVVIGAGFSVGVGVVAVGVDVAVGVVVAAVSGVVNDVVDVHAREGVPSTRKLMRPWSCLKISSILALKTSSFPGVSTSDLCKRLDLGKK